MEEKQMENRSLGDYQLLKKIGRGALGTLYLAEHRFLKRQFALKVLPEELSSERGFIQRFEENVAQVASLEHPHIAKVHNVSFADGLYFLVSDCIVDEIGETTNLAQFLSGYAEELSEEDIFSLLSQVAEALDFAHERKILHRGLKPNNILVGPGKKRSYFLSDFGLSQIVGERALLSLAFRALACNPDEMKYDQSAPFERSLQQSYLFLAPEQKQKESDQITAKSDAYAFGILTYYLLTKAYPEGYFKMPSLLRENLKYDWDFLIRATLAYDPAERPEKLKEALLQASSNCLAKERQAISMHRFSSLSHSTGDKGQKAGHELQPVIGGSSLERPDLTENPLSLLQVDSAVKPYQPEPKEKKSAEPLLTEMRVIPGGYFLRGSQEGNRDEMPRHQIYLPSFALDAHPVTNEQYVRFLEVMGGEKDSHHRDLIRLKEARIKRSGGRLSIESGYGKHPVVGVTWYGALAYCRWIGKRLPTEAEWEIAAYGGLSNVTYPTGSSIEKTQANFFSSDTTPVMSYPKNDYGLFDMVGNVYEWCQDWYGYNYYESSQQEPESPKGPLQGVYRVLRGGCWKSLKEDLACSRRHRNNPGTSNSTYGFRCAADVA